MLLSNYAKSGKCDCREVPYFQRDEDRLSQKGSCNEVVKAINDFPVATLSDNISSVKAIYGQFSLVIFHFDASFLFENG